MLLTSVLFLFFLTQLNLKRNKIPNGWKELYYEVELGVLIGKLIQRESAMDHVSGYVLALDKTCRHIQDQLKKQGHLWLLAKGFDTSCPISDFIPKSQALS